MALSASALEALLRDVLPVGDGTFAFELCPAVPGTAAAFERDGDLYACFVLSTFEAAGGEPRLRDMKQQELCVVPAAHRGDEARAAAFVRGWARGLRAYCAAPGRELDTFMPHDLVFLAALDDDGLRTEGDFEAATSDEARVAEWHLRALRDEVRDDLGRVGLGAKVDEFLALRRPAIRFAQHERVDDDEEVGRGSDEGGRRVSAPLGSTRFGGEPDLPPSVEWPASGGRPMTFAAQLDLAALGPFAAARELPSEGLLSFFYDASPDLAIDAPIENPSRVLYIPSLAGLERRPTPPGGDRRPEFVAEPDALHGTMPPLESPFYEALLPEETVAAFHRSLVAAARGPATVVDPLADLPGYLQQWNYHDAEDDDAHRVLGYCRPHQGDPYLEAEVYASGRTWKGWEPGSAGAIRTTRAARRWRLLLQICAQVDGTLLLNQDCGYLYFLLPEDALAAHDWSRVWCVLQCS